MLLLPAVGFPRVQRDGNADALVPQEPGAKGGAQLGAQAEALLIMPKLPAQNSRKHESQAEHSESGQLVGVNLNQVSQWEWQEAGGQLLREETVYSCLH